MESKELSKKEIAMRLKVLAICLIIFATAVCLTADKSDSYEFQNLEADEYTLDMAYSAELGRLFVQLDFNIPRGKTEARLRYGLFLHKDAVLQSVIISDFVQQAYQVKNLRYKHFKPNLKQKELLAKDSPVSFYGIPRQDFDLLPRVVHYRIWYYLPVAPLARSENAELATVLDSGSFWYPRNLSRKSLVKVKLTTVPEISLRMWDLAITRTVNECSWVYSVTYTEDEDNPASVRLIENRR